MATAIIGKVVSKKGSSAPVKAAKGKPSKAADKTKPAEKPAKVAKPTTWPEKFREGTIGRTIAEEIKAGKLTNAEILAKVTSKHKSDTTLACVSWYKSKWNKEQK